VAVMLPCPIAVYLQDGETFTSTMRPSALADFYPDSGIEDIAAAVEKTALEIVNEAKWMGSGASGRVRSRCHSFLIQCAMLMRFRIINLRIGRTRADEIAITPDDHRLVCRPSALNQKLQHVSRGQAMI
jgi:hypothetical protein